MEGGVPKQTWEEIGASFSAKRQGRRQSRYARKWPERSIPCPRTRETSRRKAKTEAK